MYIKCREDQYPKYDVEITEWGTRMGESVGEELGTRIGFVERGGGGGGVPVEIFGGLDWST